jgi:hypothetical protein
MGSLKQMGWGYWKIDKNASVNRTVNGVKTPPIPLDVVRKTFTKDETYLLVGCEPETMFTPGTEPEGFCWFWWDNSMMPHLRYVNPSNPEGQKWWSRLTYCGWSMPKGTPVDYTHRDRINRRLHTMSNGWAKDISDIWGGCVDTRETKKKHALICASSERNHRIFYGETQQAWIERMKQSLTRWGYTYTVRTKVGVKARKNNQVTDQLREGGFDLLVANHSAAASEGVIHGVPVVCSSNWNGAKEMATPWQQFNDTGVLNYYTAQEIDDWVTRICAYTYFRTELDSNEWIKLHPNGKDI